LKGSTMQSIYWVITRNCTQKCKHCYIGAENGAESLSSDDAGKIIENLPQEVEQVIIGGGEVLLTKDLLYETLDMLYAKYGDATRYSIQTNGDLLDEQMVEELVDRHVSRIDISSIDDFHTNRHTREQLDAILSSNGVKYLEFPALCDEDGNIPSAAYSFWGATPDLWLGGVWPRGRALKNGLWTHNPHHNFCNRWSGALGFLDNGSPQQEINVRLSDVLPCCPGTKVSLGDLRHKPLLDILDLYRNDPVFLALNQGDPEAMGAEKGITIDIAKKRIEELGSCCLWCDEFFDKYYPA